MDGKLNFRKTCFNKHLLWNLHILTDNVIVVMLNLNILTFRKKVTTLSMEFVYLLSADTSPV